MTEHIKRPEDGTPAAPATGGVNRRDLLKGFAALFGAATVAACTTVNVNVFGDEDDTDCPEGCHGSPEGCAEGKPEGCAEGKSEGCAEGKSEGCAEGKSEGCAEGKGDSEDTASWDTGTEA